MRDYVPGILGISTAANAVIAWLLAHVGIISTLSSAVAAVLGVLTAATMYRISQARLRHYRRLEQQDEQDLATGDRIDPKSWH